MSDHEAFMNSLAKHTSDDSAIYVPESMADAITENAIDSYLAGEIIASLEMSNVAFRLEQCFSSCKSPIEVMFLTAMVIADYSHLEVIAGRNKAKHEFGNDVGMLTCEPQAALEGIHVDFLLTAWDRYLDYIDHPLRRQLIVELDGHDFHEKTKQQVSRDKARDRKVQVLGIPVFRFSGSDIHRDVFGCVLECTKYLNKEFGIAEKALRASLKKD